MTDINEIEPVENIRPLKMLVISMGLVMIGGTVLLAGMVWKKVDAQTKGIGAYACDGGTADLKGSGKVLRLEQDGKHLLVTMTQNAETVTVATVDTCSGKVKNTLILKVESQKILQ